MAQPIKHPEIIKKRLKESGYSERAASEAIGLAQSKLNLSLHGKRDFPLHEAVRLCGVLRLPFSDMMKAYGYDIDELLNMPAETPQEVALRNAVRLVEDAARAAGKTVKISLK